jgi:hypothetical protein
MIALAERYGSERFEELVEEILDYTERRERHPEYLGRYPCCGFRRNFAAG